MEEKDRTNQIIAKASQMKPRTQRNFNVAFTVALTIVALLVGIIVGSNFKSIFSKIFSANSTESLDLSSVQDLYDTIKDSFMGEIDDQALVDGAKRGLVSALGDPYSAFMTESEEVDLVDDINGDFSGIGAELSLRNNAITIIRLVQGSPAQKSGLQVGDVIYTVDGVAMSDKSLSEVVGHIRGQAGTTVEVEVIRDSDEIWSFAITRAQITNPNVYSEIKTLNDKKILVLHINSFSQDAGNLAYTEAKKALEDGIDGVVLDMRGNGGGYVQSAQGVAGLWLSGQTIMTEKHIGGETAIRSTSGRNILANLPTVVLINGSTASASEIVAGALRDHHKVTLIGEKTYGKGSMQELVGLSDGNYLKITTANWYTPNGSSMNENGLEPDEKVELTIDDLNNNRDPQLMKAIDKLTK